MLWTNMSSVMDPYEVVPSIESLDDCRDECEDREDLSCDYFAFDSLDSACHVGKVDSTLIGTGVPTATVHETAVSGIRDCGDLNVH